MKRKLKSIGEHLPPVVLYFEDLEKTVEIFSENDQYQIEFHTDDYIFNNLEDIKNLNMTALFSINQSF